MSAIRLARGFTGRDVIVKFAGCYHGHVDSLLVQAGSSATTLGVPNSPGVPKGCTADTMSLPFNDTQALADAFSRRGDQIAGVILEPIAGNMGLVTPSSEFLAELRRLTHQHGALLIYDEVMTGLPPRLWAAPAIARPEAGPDGAGQDRRRRFSRGSLRREGGHSETVMPAGPVFQAGTLSGNPVAMAAGIATLRELKETSPYAELDRLGKYIAAGLRRGSRSDAGVAATVNQVGSMWTLFFSPTPVTDYDSAKKSDTARFAKFFWAMMDRGVYLPCSQFEAAFNSVLHTEERLNETITAARAALVE